MDGLKIWVRDSGIHCKVYFPAQKRNLFLHEYYNLMLNTHLYFTPAAPSRPVKMPGEKEQGIARLFNLLLFATRQMVTPNNY